MQSRCWELIESCVDLLEWQAQAIVERKVAAGGKVHPSDMPRVKAITRAARELAKVQKRLAELSYPRIPGD